MKTFILECISHLYTSSTWLGNIRAGFQTTVNGENVTFHKTVYFWLCKCKPQNNYETTKNVNDSVQQYQTVLQVLIPLDPT